MTESNEELLQAARNYVTEIFTYQVKPELVFHSLNHTEEVVEACSYIAAHSELSEEDRLVLMLAAWFHDTGYVDGEASTHEQKSIELSSEFLSRRGVDEKLIMRVTSAIEATRMPQSPVNIVEKILCDADLYHLSTDDFKAKSQLLRQEREWLLGQNIPKKEWNKHNIEFLENHKYFTQYGQESLEPKKLVNLNSIQKKKKGKDEEEAEHEGRSEEY
jgi:predicted metal-dependent HD superfamily phosphohydrolase